jgi:hypothetical protein
MALKRSALKSSAKFTERKQRDRRSHKARRNQAKQAAPAQGAHLDHRHDQSRLRRIAERVRRSKDDHRAARPPHPSLRHRRDRQRQLALQEPRLIFSKRLFTDPRSPRPRNPNQVRSGERCRLDPSSTKRSLLGSDAILMTFESRKSDHAGFAKGELSAAVHLALHELQFCDLTFCLSIGPGK